MLALVAPVFQTKVYPAVGFPPVAAAVALPLPAPKQRTSTLLAVALSVAQFATVAQVENLEVLLLFWVLVAVIWLPALTCPALKSSVQMPAAGVVTVPSSVFPWQGALVQPAVLWVKISMVLPEADVPRICCVLALVMTGTAGGVPPLVMPSVVLQ